MSANVPPSVPAWLQITAVVSAILLGWLGPVRQLGRMIETRAARRRANVRLRKRIVVSQQGHNIFDLEISNAPEAAPARDVMVLFDGRTLADFAASPHLELQFPIDVLAPGQKKAVNLNLGLHALPNEVHVRWKDASKDDGTATVPFLSIEDV